MSKLVRAGIAGFLFILIILGLNWQTGVATEIIMPMIGDFVWEDMNANGIQDPGEGGIGGVLVDLYVYGDLMPMDPPVYSDASGYYAIANIQPGMMYSLGFHAPSGY
ncbi:MAG TPA: SdrD B-like domain-containing protein, partial [bacterium]|nr:SdrD B-like domain-containing protein [bacterium]